MTSDSKGKFKKKPTDWKSSLRQRVLKIFTPGLLPVIFHKTFSGTHFLFKESLV